MRKVKDVLRAARKRCTRRAAWWFVKVNAQSWAGQIAAVAGLTAVGVGPVAALVSAKATAWFVFAWQCLREFPQRRNER